MRDERKTLHLKVPKELALEAKALHEDIDLNVTQSVVVCLKLGIQNRRASIEGRTGEIHGSDRVSSKA
jgi:hypothetical protein